jgi:hypothetical protein
VIPTEEAVPRTPLVPEMVATDAEKTAVDPGLEVKALPKESRATIDIEKATPAVACTAADVEEYTSCDLNASALPGETERATLEGSSGDVSVYAPAVVKRVVQL